ncbi:hypothetical protein ACFQV4_14280 [Streptomyces thermocarboxydus]
MTTGTHEPTHDTARPGAARTRPPVRTRSGPPRRSTAAPTRSCATASPTAPPNSSAVPRR